MKSLLTTLCYIEQADEYLILHRISKKNDVNKDKWIGIGGHFENGESPEECLLREVKEETGLTLTDWRFRGIVTFESLGVDQEYMCLYTASGFEGTLIDCDEGVLEWIPRSELMRLNLWEGDRIFLRLLAEEAPFFSLKLTYRGDVLAYAALDGRELELFDLCDENGIPTGRVTERSVAHCLGLMHRTSHIWVVRPDRQGGWELLLQERSSRKNSFPSCLDVSSAGHVKAGDSYEESAVRELEEELGIRATPAELEYVGRFDSGDILAEFDGRPFHDREISAVYVYRGEIDASKLRLQPEEVDAVHWMSYGECLSRVEQRDPAFCVNIRGLRMLGEYLLKCL